MRRLIPRELRFFDDFERQSEHAGPPASSSPGPSHHVTAWLAFGARHHHLLRDFTPHVAAERRHLVKVTVIDAPDQRGGSVV
jgi:hypothetical protein